MHTATTPCRLQRSLAVLTLAAVFVAAGCNTFGFRHGESTNDVAELLSNARAALDAGDADDAVEALEKAHELEPENVEVRIELANALYAAHDIDIFVVRDVAKLVAGDEQTAARGKQEGSALECTDGADPIQQGYFKISFADAEGVRTFLRNELMIQRIAHLVDEDLLETEAFDELDDEVRARGLLMVAFNAVAEIALRIYNTAQTYGASLYRDPDGNVVFCAPTELRLEDTEHRACDVARKLALVRRLLILRNRIIGAEPRSGLLIEPLGRMLHAVKERLGCTPPVAIAR